MKITAPEEFGFSPDRLKRIDAVMQRYVDQKTLAGIVTLVARHGWGGWANTHFWVDPQEQLIGILMLQYVPSGTYPVTNDFRTLVYQALID